MYWTMNLKYFWLVINARRENSLHLRPYFNQFEDNSTTTVCFIHSNWRGKAGNRKFLKKQYC